MMIELIKKINNFFVKKSKIIKIKKIGNNFKLLSYSTILTPEYMEIGDNVIIGEYTHISAELIIGNNVMLGPRVIILGGNHYFAIEGKSVRFLHPKGRENSKPIMIEDEVWCGAAVIILCGVTLGMGSVIGAGSVVTKSIPPYTVAAGNYCKPIYKIFDDTVLERHLRKLGMEGQAIEKIISRRNDELIMWKCENIATIDRTNTYWDSCEVVKGNTLHAEG